MRSYAVALLLLPATAFAALSIDHGHYFIAHPDLSKVSLAVTNETVAVANSSSSTRPLVVTNLCSDTIWPALYTQHGTGPSESDRGFELADGATHSMQVDKNWQGRIWGRTNCSFNANGTGPPGVGVGPACYTGDCGGLLSCVLTGATPVTLAEFTLLGPDGQTYYDISLVDGYNLPMAITFIPPSDPKIKVLPPNLTNPICIASSGYFSNTQDFSPYRDGSSYTGTNSSNPLAFASQVTLSQVQRWCPWDLQLAPPYKPGNGVYPYPDDNIQRPAFCPCYSDCAKTNAPQSCCTGKYNNPNVCKAGLYSNHAKKVCPDAYTFAYDDQKSTFIIPSGGGFQVTFCPSGQSTNIIATTQFAGQKAVSAAVGRRSTLPADEGLWVLWAVLGLSMFFSV